MKFLASLSLLLVACTTSSTSPCPAVQPREPQCPFGQPVTLGADLAPIIVQRDQYTLAYSPTKRVPRWVCETVRSQELIGFALRKSNYPLDPLVPRPYQSASAEFINSRYDRGHLLPAANQRWYQNYSDQTFYMSNVAPMLRGFNRGVWNQFEAWIRTWVNQHGDAYVITGTIFVNTSEWTSHRAEAVKIPSHYYKVLVAKRGTLTYHAIGFLFNQRKTYTPPYDWQEYVVPLDVIESLGRVNLLPSLSPLREAGLERRAATFSLWER